VFRIWLSPKVRPEVGFHLLFGAFLTQGYLLWKSTQAVSFRRLRQFFHNVCVKLTKLCAEVRFSPSRKNLRLWAKKWQKRGNSGLIFSQTALRHEI
jgi:hypothetical protein